jgi:hypothetical protein
MGCPLCIYAGQFALNIANLLDHALNTILLGDANETVSLRTARARRSGARWAIHACNVLTFASRVATLGFASEDHCTWALDESLGQVSREIWDWNTGVLHQLPQNIVPSRDIGRR